MMPPRVVSTRDQIYASGAALLVACLDMRQALARPVPRTTRSGGFPSCRDTESAELCHSCGHSEQAAIRVCAFVLNDSSVRALALFTDGRPSTNGGSCSRRAASSVWPTPDLLNRLTERERWEWSLSWSPVPLRWHFFPADSDGIRQLICPQLESSSFSFSFSFFLVLIPSRSAVDRFQLDWNATERGMNSCVLVVRRIKWRIGSRTPIVGPF